VLKIPEKIMKAILGLMGFTGMLTGFAQATMAQVVPDGTIPTNVTSLDSLNFTIDGGARSGNNLFHSFSQFSVPTNGSAVFNHATDVQNIFSRVTGGVVSNIDGLIRANGTANLFLLNPSGILFGPNARLQIGGSLIGATANSIKFVDGVEFSAVNATETPLLTMSVPVGLQFGQQSGSIRVEGRGQSFLRSPNFTTPVLPDPNLAGLQVANGNTIALLGNGIQVNGGVLKAESGQIELGSVSSGMVNLNAVGNQWQFSNYPAVQNRSDIQLTGAALVDTSGNPGGSIQLQGKTIQVLNSSVVMVQHRGALDAIAPIQVNADRLELSGILPGKPQSLILSENLSQGQGPHIQVFARQVVTRDGGELFSNTFQNGGKGGNISIQAAESIYFSGSAAFDPTRTSGIISRSNRGGDLSGNVQIVTPDLSLDDGASIQSNVFGGRGGGDIDIKSERLSLTGENSRNGSATFMAAFTGFGGKGGALTIETGRLRLQRRGALTANTTGEGNAGVLTINARESIELDAEGTTVLPARISSSGTQLPLSVRRALGLPEFPSGNGGNLFITAPRITVRNGAYIAAENVGSGDAGTVKIQADAIELERQGEIRTSTKVGNGGNLELTVRDLLFLRYNSLISAKAGGTGTGGNVTINAPVIVGLDNSDIIANAVGGRGGNININTQGVIGLKYRNRLTPENDITASSEFGVNGTVQVNNLGVDPNSGLVALPVDIVDPNQQIAQGCDAVQGGSFVATGRGGVPQDPTQIIKPDRPWSDLRAIDTEDRATIFIGKGSANAQSPNPTSSLIEATNWQRNPDGSVEILASAPRNPASSSIATCAK
jgi:filamentous hemagglutinin family protein